MIPFARPIIGDEEKRAVVEVLEGPILTHGPRTKEFEAVFAAYTGVGFALSLSSCTAALHLAYFYLGLGVGDEVIVPAQTHVATAHAVELCGAKPVFVDAEPLTGNIDLDQIEARITGRTRAISVVHFLGMPVNMERIVALARKYDLFVVEDCALAIGTYFKGRHAGLHGDVGCFSFYPAKHLTTAEGGMLITNREEIAVRVARQRAFGVDRQVGERTVPGVYDVNMLGLNYRMSELQAAVGIVQMGRIDGFLQKRRENYAALSAGLRDIDGLTQFQSSHGDYESSYYCLSILLDEPLKAKRLELINHLNQNGVGTSIYYPQPVPHLHYYRKKYGYGADSFPVAARISGSSIALPVGPHLGSSDVDYILETLKNAVKAVS